MFEDFNEIEGSDSTYLGTSPPCRPVIAESSDLFRAVMEDLIEEETRLSRAVVDKSTKKTGAYMPIEDSKSKLCDTICDRCSFETAVCRCQRKTSRDESHRVHWIDEMYDKPLAREKTVTDLSDRLGCSVDNIDNVKPILKHKANCIIIVSE